MGENQDVNSIDEMSNENNTLPDDLFIENNQQTPPSAQIVDSSEENTSIEKADEKESQQETKEEVPHKEDPSQFEYWQGEADKRTKELEDFKNKYTQDRKNKISIHFQQSSSKRDFQYNVINTCSW